jgi:hypothetical protein
MTLPIYELKISENLQDEAQVDYIALVDAPAIKKDFLAFNDQLSIYGFSPKYFYLCPKATELFKHLVEMNVGINEQGMLRSAGQIADNIFNIEYEAKQKRIVSLEDYNEAVLLLDDFIDLMAEIDKLIGMQHDVSFMKSHIDTIKTFLPKIEKAKFSILSEEQRIISGALMLADELIFRAPNKSIKTDHYVKFSADTIKMIAIKFAKKKYQNNVNLMHNPEQKVKGVTMFESWLVDKERGIMPMKGFEGVADGSWFGSFYVENEKVWQSIKKGDYKGFSVEGLFDYVEPITAEENALKKISELLNSIVED